MRQGTQLGTLMSMWRPKDRLRKNLGGEEFVSLEDETNRKNQMRHEIEKERS